MNCLCKRNCATHIDVVKQKELFDKYHALKSWKQKTTFIREIVVRKMTDKENINPIIQLKKKVSSLSCFLIDDQGVKRRVCIGFILKILQISRSKLFRSVESTDRNPFAIDRRGKNRGRLSKPEDKLFVQNFIKSIAQYESKWNSSRSTSKFLHPDLNFNRLYAKYKESCSTHELKEKSLGYFKKIFKTFNIDFAKHRTPTCWKCHEMNSNTKRLVFSPESRTESDERKQTHLEFARNVVDDFQKEVLNAQTEFENTEIFTFGLGRPFALPSVASDHTKQHFFLYQMCLFDEVRQISYIYMWPESVTSKGTAEIASCIVRHLHSNLSANTKRLILYCDPHHGQNRNLKLSLMLQHFLHSCEHPELRSIKQIFFAPGHGYNNCDRCFERVMRKESVQNIFLPSHLIDRINQPNHKVYATEMHKEDFLSTKPLEALVTIKTVELDGRESKWSSYRSITYDRDKPITLNIDLGNNVIADLPLKTQNVDYKFSEINLPQLYPNGRIISALKYNVLQEILILIPTEFHNFYRSLKYTDVEDYAKDYAFCARESSDEEEEVVEEEECQHN